MTLTLENKILLQFGDKRKHLQPHEIDANSTDKEIAISNLLSHSSFPIKINIYDIIYKAILQAFRGFLDA